MTDEDIRIIGYAYMMGYKKGKQDVANSVKNRIESEYMESDLVKAKYVIQYIDRALNEGGNDAFC
jgi:hypothetical protein